jgi:hypothetical protein
VRGDLATDGTLTFTGTITVTGNQCNPVRWTLNGLKSEERKRWVSRVLGKFAPKLTLDSYGFDNLSENYDQPLTLRFEGMIEKFGVKSRDRMFINPNIFNRNTAEDVLVEEERQFPIFYEYAYLDEDSVIITIPDGYGLEASPEATEITVPFGHFGTSHSFSDGVLTYTRKIGIEQSQIPPTLYGDYQAFMKTAVKNDMSKFVLRREAGL